MKIAMVTTSLSRAGGGLFPIVCRLAHIVRDAGNDIRVLGVRDAYTQLDGEAWSPIQPETFRSIGPSRLAFAPALSRRVARMPRRTLVHLHGIWQGSSLATLHWTRSGRGASLVSPHGMLDPFALQRSRWRKEIAASLYERSNLSAATCIHALNDAEYRACRAYGLTNPIAIVPNGVDPVSDAREDGRPASFAAEGGARKMLLFLSRVHPKKGLEPLLDAWQAVPERRRDWCLVVAGPDELGHTAQLQARARKLGIERDVLFVGPQFGALKHSWLTSADAFVLPSFSEGLPLAVLEAMAYGLPVLMTSECNLGHVADEGAGLLASPTAASLAGGLETLLSLPPEARTAMGRRGRDLVRRDYAWPTIAGQMLDLYAWLLDGGATPAFVRTV